MALLDTGPCPLPLRARGTCRNAASASRSRIQHEALGKLVLRAVRDTLAGTRYPISLGAVRRGQ